jgi:hypothetical protein
MSGTVQTGMGLYCDSDKKDAACSVIALSLAAFSREWTNVMLQLRRRSAIIVRFKEARINARVVQAANAAICEDQLVLLDSEGELVAYFPFELVEALIKV